MHIWGTASTSKVGLAGVQCRGDDLAEEGCWRWQR